MKCDYVVALMRANGTLNYVTAVDNAAKTYLCESGKPALRMIESRAKNLMYCMACNDCPVAILTVPQGRYQLSNPVCEMEGDANGV